MRLTGLLVLLIDDHLDSLEIGEMSLLRDGARVLAAPSADTGLRFLDAHPVDVIVSDISMPRIDGYELVRLVRARRDEKRTTPALAMTGNATAQDVRMALDAGFDAHAAKPLKPDALIAHVERLARGRERARAPRPGRVIGGVGWRPRTSSEAALEAVLAGQVGEARLTAARG